MPYLSKMSLIISLKNWIETQSLLEVSGVITGILCVYLAAKNKIWSWPLAIISVLIYVIIFSEAKLYADAGLQIYFLIMNIYGWYFWSRKHDQQAKVPVSHISFKESMLSVFSILMFTAVLGTYLYRGTDASFPYLDSFCTACSLVAQLLLARKIIENWLIWIVVDIIYVWVYISKDLHLTAGMYTLYILIAAIGYVDWKKSLSQQVKSAEQSQS